MARPPGMMAHILQKFAACAIVRDGIGLRTHCDESVFTVSVRREASPQIVGRLVGVLKVIETVRCVFPDIDRDALDRLSRGVDYPAAHLDRLRVFEMLQIG